MLLSLINKINFFLFTFYMNIMIRQIVVGSTLALLLKLLSKNGGISEITSFRPFGDTTLIGGIVSNILVVILFAELYWGLDKSDDEEHFGFKSPLDAYYFSTVTSSSVGYGDFLPLSNKAKMLNMTHIVVMFFIFIPIVLEALKPGN